MSGINEVLDVPAGPPPPVPAGPPPPVPAGVPPPVPVPAAIDADLLGVTQDDMDAFTKMNNTVYLAAQLEAFDKSADMKGSLENIFGKTAKYYYGVQTNNGVDKRMYRKNDAKMDKKRLAKETEDGSKSLDVVPQEDEANVNRVKNGLSPFLGSKLPITSETDGLFTDLKINGTGARVAFIAKYIIFQGKVSAFGKLVLIKGGGKMWGDSASVNLVIKNNTIMKGSGRGSGVAMSKLLQTLFGANQPFGFTENLLDAPPADPVVAAAPQVALNEELLANTPVVEGGKSTRRKRKGSRKKGGNKKSHKKRKSGASKKKRSHPKRK
jgi:hypothetical protein